MLNGGGALELPYSIRLFSRVKIRMGYRDPVLFFSNVILCVRIKIEKKKMKKRNKILMIGLLSTALSMNMVGVGSTKISINRKTYQEGNTNLVLNKILSDNELKQEIPHMFNYASNGDYTNYDMEALNNPNYITEGLYSNVDEDGTTYYYRGNVKNNNLQFGAYDEDYYVYGSGTDGYYQSQESCQAAGVSDCSAVKLAPAGSKMYWKIVRINGDGSIRLIYNGTSSSPSNSELASSFSVGYVPYNLKDNEPKYTGYTYDNGTDSFVKREIDTWYNNTLGKNSAYDSMVILGRFCSDSSGYHYNETFGGNLFASWDRLAQASQVLILPKIMLQPLHAQVQVKVMEEVIG